MLKDVLIDVDEQTKDDPDFHLLVPVHDEVLAECREGREAHYMALLKREMERAWPQLNGLSIETEGKWGYNWAEAGDDNPRGMRPYVD